MHPAFVSTRRRSAVPIWFVTADTYAQLRERLDAAARRFADTARFEPKAGAVLLLPGEDGALAASCSGWRRRQARQRPLPARPPAGLLPAGVYRFANAPHDPRLAALAFALGSYHFTRYRKPDERSSSSICRKASIATNSCASSRR